MTSWEETPLGRLTTHIHNLFEDYFKKHPQRDRAQDNALLEVRNLVLQSVETLLKESGIHKQYGVPIDSLSLVSFASDDEPANTQSSWLPIPGGEDEARPAGITNEEFKETIDKLVKLFNENRMYGSALHQEVTAIFHEAFFKPAINKPFRNGTYVRLAYGTGESEFEKSQNVPCEICGENRVIDICHIVPRRVNGTGKIDNVLFLCPTHHRLFDACMLSKEEWDKIDWGRKARKSQAYAEKVLMVAHRKFWEKVNAGIYRRQTTWETNLYELYKKNEKNIEE